MGTIVYPAEVATTQDGYEDVTENNPDNEANVVPVVPMNFKSAPVVRDPEDSDPEGGPSPVTPWNEPFTEDPRPYGHDPSLIGLFPGHHKPVKSDVGLGGVTKLSSVADRHMFQTGASDYKGLHGYVSEPAIVAADKRASSPVGSGMTAIRELKKSQSQRDVTMQSSITDDIIFHVFDPANKVLGQKGAYHQIDGFCCDNGRCPTNTDSRFKVGELEATTNGVQCLICQSAITAKPVKTVKASSSTAASSTGMGRTVLATAGATTLRPKKN
jgi:hypothetical protein